MKTTIELPDQLMTEVKQLADREQRQINDVMAELVRAGIENRGRLTGRDVQPANANEWLVEWQKLGEEALRDAPSGPTATEILDKDRNRLE